MPAVLIRDRLADSVTQDPNTPDGTDRHPYAVDVDRDHVDGVIGRLIGMVLTRNGELADSGAGAAALGDPFTVVAWLANTLAGEGVALEAGRLIMTGALHAAVPMVTAEFDRLGPVTIHVGATD